MSTCLYCPQELHDLCRESDSCCCQDDKPLIDRDTPVVTTVKELVEGNSVGAPVKTENFKDLLSTGRKRAQKLYAIQPGQQCDWAWKRRCGGGYFPVTGCSGRPAEHIHHGPDKSVLNNKPNNISVVCTHCHNLWHARNNSTYTGDRPKDGSAWLPEAPKSETELDAVMYALSDAEEAEAIEIITFEYSMGRQVSVEALQRLNK